MSQQLDLVKKYVRWAETLNPDENIALEILHPDYSQWELPNLLNKAGQKSDIKDSLRRIEIAKTILSSQKFEISSLIEQDATAVIEARWTGTLAVDAGALKKGQVLKAYFCMVFEFKDEKIHRIRNYDCFETG